MDLGATTLCLCVVFLAAGIAVILLAADEQNACSH
jgi:hypothetical protein